MSTPLGDFVRAKRDSLQPESFGLPDHGRRRAPGLRRTELAMRAGISVEYLTRIEQGRDRNPSPAVLNALADALSLDAGERHHLRYLAKITGGACPGHRPPAPPNRDVRPTVLATLRLLEPGIAFVTNRLGDVLAYTSGFELVMRGTGLLDAETPNLTTYVFTDPRARAFLPDWDQVADEQVFDLWLGPSAETSEWFRATLAPVAGPEFTRRLHRHLPPPQVPLRLRHPDGHEFRWHRERLELPSTDAQELVVLLPADESTAQAVERLRHQSGGILRAVS
ncbi:helix-turn-helix domain-containing protein [Micromonospora globbae]|jgi:transcriptional regulator with XRE-family HTH domain|uniref:helix-turn-helix domain-containing protein n=1 Tax=Micromonospora globbae TaxID=1894969 RepID=UPI00341CE906